MRAEPRIVDDFERAPAAAAGFFATALGLQELDETDARVKVFGRNRRPALENGNCASTVPA